MNARLMHQLRLNITITYELQSLRDELFLSILNCEQKKRYQEYFPCCRFSYFFAGMDGVVRH